MTDPLRRRARAREGGISLMEMMVALAIVAIMAAVAIPTYARYTRRAKSAEARDGLDRLAAGARGYYMTLHTDADGRRLARQFPGAGAGAVTAPVGACCDQTGDRCSDATVWNAALWRALGFRMNGSYYYQYRWEASGSEASAAFTARALGDLDCDGTVATWSRTGGVDPAAAQPLLGSVIVDPTMEIE